MKPETVSAIYRFSLLALAFIIASPLYPATLAVLVPVFFCWLYFRDYKNLAQQIARPQILWPVLLYIIVFVGCFFSNNSREAISSLSTKLPLLLFPAIVSTSSIVDKKMIKQAGNLIIIAVSVSLAIAIGYALTDIYVTGVNKVQVGEAIYYKWQWYGLTRNFDNWHPTYVAVGVNIALALLLYNLFNAENHLSIQKILTSTALFVFLTISLVLLNAMIGLIGYFSVLVYSGLQLLKHIHVRPLHRLLLLLCSLVLALLFFFINPLQIKKLNDLKNGGFKITDVQGERNLLTMRMAKWDAYVAVIADHWLLGTTEGDIKDVRNRIYLEKGYNDLHHYGYNAHNQYVENFAMYGVAGFVLLLLMMLHPLVNAGYHPYYIPFIFIVAITFLTESLLQRQQGILLYMFLYAFFTNYRVTEKK